MTASGPSPIGGYEDWPAFVRSTPHLRPADARADALACVLGVRRPPAPAVQTVDRREVDGIEISRLEYNVGYGPNTGAYLLRPAGVTASLPGLLGMHAHGGRRWMGAEQCVDPGHPFDTEYARARRREGYGGRAVANDLARAGFAVLVHDTFSWGSRRFDLTTPPPKLTRLLDALAAQRSLNGEQEPEPAVLFDEASALHEDLLAKTAGLLGTTFAGTIVTDDLVALDVLASHDGVDPARIGTWGFSGGGARAHYLGALDPRVRAVSISCMMATFDSLIPDYVDAHTWLLHSPGLPQVADWPEIGAIEPGSSSGPRRILVQYGERDPLFPAAGMAAAHRRLQGVASGYEGRFYPTGHEFGVAMQEDAADFFRVALGADSGA